MTIGIKYTVTQLTAKLHSIETAEPKSRKRKRPAHLEDSVIITSVGSRESQSTSKGFKQQLFFPILDKFLVEMNERFSDSNNLVLKGIGACSQTSSKFISFQEIKPFAQMYDIDIDMLEIEVSLISRSIASLSNVRSIAEFGIYLHSCQPAYQNLFQTVQIALTIDQCRV